MPPLGESMSRKRVPHLVVVGGGFAGLWATRALARERIRITLVDRRNHHLFQPLLYQVATAGLSAPDIAAPLRHILGHQRNVEVRLGEVVAIDKRARQIRMADGSTLDYDSLLLATGATHAYFGNDQWADDAPGLKTLDDAIALRRKLLLAFERAEAEPDPAKKAAWLSFAVVGGGPTGVELAGTLAEIARHTLRNEFRHIDPASARVRLVEAGPRAVLVPGCAFAEGASPTGKAGRGSADRYPGERHRQPGLQARRTVRTGAHRGLGRRRGRFTAGAHAGRAAGPRRTRAGATGPDPARSPGAVRGRRPGRTEPGRRQAGTRVAPAAKQMGKYVAEVIRARLHGKPEPGPFKYADYGNLATIGRMAAIVHLGRLQLSGVLAWWFWLAAHVFFLIGFRNRIVVLLNWAVAYWSYQRSARIIFGDDQDDRRPKR